MLTPLALGLHAALGVHPGLPDRPGFGQILDKLACLSHSFYPQTYNACFYCVYFIFYL